MVLHKAFRLRLYPTEEQRTLIYKTIGCARFVFTLFQVKTKSGPKLHHQTYQR